MVKLIFTIFLRMNYADSCHATKLLNLTTTGEPFLLYDDVIICDVGLLLLIMINTMMFSVDEKHLITPRSFLNYSASFLRISKQEMVSWWFKLLAGKKWQIWLRSTPCRYWSTRSTRMLKTSSLCIVKKIAHTAIVLLDRQHVKHTFLVRLYIAWSRN